MRARSASAAASAAVWAALVLVLACVAQPFARAAPGDSCGAGDVTTYGATGNDTSDDTAAIQAASAAAGKDPLCFPAGKYYFSSTLTHTPGYIGQARENTVLHYTGSGTALSSPTPGTRTFHTRITGLSLVSDSASPDLGRDGIVPTPPAPAAAIGLDFPCVSRAYTENVLITGFATGLKISCATDGGSLYDVFSDLTVAGATTGIRITGLSSNEHKFWGCRVNGSAAAVLIDGGNRNVFDGCAFETGGTGVEVLNADSDRNQVTSSRFENLSGFSVRVAPGVRGTVLAWNDRVSTAGAYQTNGTDTAVIGNDPGNGTLTMERTGAGSGPLFQLRDTASSSDPLTAQIQTSRWSGVPLQIDRTSDSTLLLRVNGDGAVKLRAVTSLPSASRAGVGALLVYDGPSAPPKLILSTGSSGWVYVDGGGSVP